MRRFGALLLLLIIENVLLQLSINLRPPGCKKLKGEQGSVYVQTITG